MALSSTVYNALFRRTSTFAFSIVVASFFFERTFELGCEEFFKSHNKGKLFADMKKAEE